jgi:N4-(beta-N-acetylglucosaminyl)-L-asparaginase
MVCFLNLKDILPSDFSYQVVESMRLGMEPKLAAKDAISRIARKFPDFVGAVFAINKNGVHAGACHGWTFQYSVRSPEMDDVEVFTVLP